MEVLNLIIKQKYFDAILQGRKVQEFREVRPSNIKRYVQLDEEGFEVEDENGNAIPVHYDAIRFRVKDSGDTALVEVTSSLTQVFVDEENKPYTYEYGTDKEGYPMLWFAEQVVYNLGKILEHEVREKSEKV